MPRLYVATAETSGDRLAAAIVAELRGRGSIELRGMGGPALAAQDVHRIADAREAEALGLVEVVTKLPGIWALKQRIIADLERWKPDVLLTVDAPGLMLRIAAEAKRLGIPVVHAVSPQVWAWRPGRVNSIAASLDTLLCLLPFEPELYDSTGLDARFVGHPLVHWRRQQGRAPASAPRVALLPGSREQEVLTLWPVFRDAAAELRRRLPEVRFVVVRAPGIDPALLAGLDAEVVEELADAADATAALASSGTATIELAALGIPMVVAYRAHPLTWALGTALVRGVRDLALPNIVAGRQVVPEHLQDIDAKLLAADLAALHGPAGDLQRAELRRVVEQLRPDGAVERCADAVQERLSTESP